MQEEGNLYPFDGVGVGEREAGSGSCKGAVTSVESHIGAFESDRETADMGTEGLAGRGEECAQKELE